MSLRLDIQKSSPRSEDTTQKVCPTYNFFTALLLHQQVLGVFDAAAARESIASTEDFKELLVGKPFFAISCANFAREHGREFFIELNELLCYCQTLCLVGIEHFIARIYRGWSEAIQGMH
jgi:hypothetical protein